MKKLVRNIIGRRVYDWPNKPENVGYKVIHNLTREDYILALKDKLIEEAHEVYQTRPESGKWTETLLELGDVYEVMRCMAKELNFSMDDIVLSADYKRMTLGDFTSKWMLEEV